MSITKLAQEIEALETSLTAKRAELMALLSGTNGKVITLSKPLAPRKVTKVVKGPSISERVRTELSKRPGGISFPDLRQLTTLSMENPASIKSVLKKDRKDNEVWFDGSLYGLGAKKPGAKPKKKTPAKPSQNGKTQRGSGSAGETAVAAPVE